MSLVSRSLSGVEFWAFMWYVPQPCGAKMLIGYARVSTPDQKIDLQVDALTKAGCERIFSETASGAKSDRVKLSEALDFARQAKILGHPDAAKLIERLTQ